MMDQNNLVNRIVKLIEDARTEKSCLSCEHFDEPKEACAAFDNLRPPARIIATGCSAYQGKVPF
jgi:hypothetical protein